MSRRIAAASLFIVLAVSACSGATPTPSARADGSAQPTAVPSPTVEGIAHPTGATDVVLRFDESGGFVPAEFLAAHVPIFTLYGDGTVVFVSSVAPAEQAAGEPSLGQPIRTARLSEEQVQTLLAFALRDGGLGTARAEYQNPLVADAATAVFELNAEGGSKTVSVVALGMEDQQPGPDTAIKKALAGLGAKLRDFDLGGSLASAPFGPSAYRGVLLEAQGLQGVRFRDWPWTTISPKDFVTPRDPNVIQQATRVLTPAEVDVLGVDGAERGIVGGIYLRDAAGKTYTFALRPLLPDEKQ